jgi:AcrR family transcriptional regulator
VSRARASDGKPDGRRERHRHRRSQLLAAATDYAFEHGLAHLSLRPLADALGVSHRTLLYHFGSKEQLLVEILKEARGRERLWLAAQRHGDTVPTPVELLRVAWARWSSPQHLRYFRFYFEMHGLALRDPEVYRDFLHGVVADWISILEAVLKEEEIDAHEARPLVTFVFGAVRGLQLDLLTTGDRARVDGGMEELVAALEERLSASRRAAEPARQESSTERQ